MASAKTFHKLNSRKHFFLVFFDSGVRSLKAAENNQVQNSNYLLLGSKQLFSIYNDSVQYEYVFLNGNFYSRLNFDQVP